MVKDTFKIVVVVNEQNKDLIWSLLQISLQNDNAYFAFEGGTPSQMIMPSADKKAKIEKPTLSRKQVSKLTKKSVTNLKNQKRVFTNSIYGWDNKKDGTLVPNWKEQALIDQMRFLHLEKKMPAGSIAKWLRAEGAKGKRGGKFTSTSILRTISNEFHAGRNDFKKPEWFTNNPYPEMTWGKNPKIVSE